ncbi:MAG: hypothetical protein JWQ19_557 [Subtercola sp.]|nr:hypothetical protein [Subtercola sp.]
MNARTSSFSTIRRVVALGSSFAAGPGIEPCVDADAMRSGRNYAHLLAEHLGADLVDLSVSGATTANILTDPQLTMTGVTFAPQIGGVPADADLITITAGGNDLRFLGSMLFTAWSNLEPGSPVTQMLAQDFPDGIRAATPDDITAAAGGLERVVAAVRSRAPAGRIVLVDYLTILSRDASQPSRSRGPNITVGTRFDTPFDAAQFDLLLHLQESVAQAFRVAKDRTGVELVVASAHSAQHGMGSAEPWVFGFEAEMTHAARSFHPNAAGMRAVADLLIAHLHPTTP